MKIEPDLLIFQPIVTSYRLPILEHFAHERGWTMRLLAGTPSGHVGFKALNLSSLKNLSFLETPALNIFSGRLVWQKKVIQEAVFTQAKVVWLCGNPRDLSMWLALLVLWLRQKPVFVHGQGVYANKRRGQIYKAMWQCLISLSSGYIAYTELSKQSLIDSGIRREKILVAHNSLEIKHTVSPKSKDFTKTGVLFIGRLREESRIDLLINAIAYVRSSTGINVTLDIIGDGLERARMQEKYVHLEWLRWHGAVYSDQDIAKISLSSVIGCYPGNAGLSVVQYMALGLVPVVHSDIEVHMGPEPSYIIDQVNGRLFDKEKGIDHLASIIAELLQKPAVTEILAGSAWRTYEELTNPSLGRRFASIFEPFIEGIPSTRA